MTKLSDMPKITKTNHTAQIKWLDGQIRKNNNSIFLNPKLALPAYEKINDIEMGLVTNRELEKFISRYLSESGIKKLVTTLRVAETRSKCGFSLQVTISNQSKSKLDYLANKTGMKKNEIVEKLLELADLEKITKTEQQLEITL